MRIDPLISLSCFPFVGMLGILVATCGEAAATEGTTASGITVQEAERIWQIEHLIAKYRAATTRSGKQAVLEDLKKLYLTNRDSFLEVIIINAFLEIDELDTLQEEAPTPAYTFLQFAASVAGGAKSATRYLAKVDDPGLRQFLETWLVFRGEIDAIDDQSAPHRRQALISSARSRISGEIKGRASEARVARLVRCLTEFDTPYEYQACIALLAREHEVAPKGVVSELRRVVMSRLPGSTPPPYSRDHTLVHIVCTVAKTVNDASFVELLEELEKSENSYVSAKASEALLWLRREVKFPFRYSELWRSYWSRS